jgi:hypothetical protein
MIPAALSPNFIIEIMGLSSFSSAIISPWAPLEDMI